MKIKTLAAAALMGVSSLGFIAAPAFSGDGPGNIVETAVATDGFFFFSCRCDGR